MWQSPIRNGSGETPSPRPRIQQNTLPPLHQYFHSTIFVQKLRHFNTLILIFRFAAFCSSVAASVFMLVNLRGLDSPRWYDFDAIRDGGPKYIFFRSSGRIRGQVEGSDSDSDISIFAFDPPRCHPYFGPLCAVVSLPENITIPAVLVFGDSIVDQGNNNGIAATFAKSNFPPYGKDFMGGIPTGRFCNGKTPPDLLAEELGIKEFVPAYLDPNLQATDLLTGVSFASGGAGFDPQTSQTAACFSLDDQLKMFREYIGKIKGIVGEDRANFVLTNSLYFVVVGSDDLANTYFTLGIRKLQYDINSYTNFMVQLACDFVKEVYALGAKRIAFLSIPPIGCLPSQRTLAGGVTRVCAENYNQAAKLFNTKIKAALNSLSNSLNDAQVRIVYIDIYNPFYDLIQNHGKYGFSIADRGCCGTGKIEVTVLCNKLSKTCPDDSMYLFWDSFHPSERAYKILVNMILRKYIIDLL